MRAGAVIPAHLPKHEADQRTFYFGPKANPFHFEVVDGRMAFVAGISPFNDTDVMSEHMARSS